MGLRTKNGNCQKVHGYQASLNRFFLISLFFYLSGTTVLTELLLDYKLKFKQNCLLIFMELLLVHTGVHHIGRTTETQQFTNPLLILHFFLSSHSLYLFSRLRF